MKQNTTKQPDSKEGLHTLEVVGYNSIYERKPNGSLGKLIAIADGLDARQSKVNAELIVKAVNFYTNVKDLADKYPSNNDKPHELAHISNNDLSAYKLHTKILLRLIEEGALNERKALLDALKDTLMLAEELKFESEKAYQICETAKKLINNAKNI